MGLRKRQFLLIVLLVVVAGFDGASALEAPRLAKYVPDDEHNGCGSNSSVEAALRVSPEDRTYLAAPHIEEVPPRIPLGSDVWRGVASPDPCPTLEYRGRPDNLPLLGAPSVTAPIGVSNLPRTIAFGAGADVDLAVATERNPLGAYTVYMTSQATDMSLYGLNNERVITSLDNGGSWINTPIRVGNPIGDRPWLAAFGSNISLLTYQATASLGIPVLRSDVFGLAYLQIADAFIQNNTSLCLSKAGNVAIDHKNLAFPDVLRATFRAYVPYSARLATCESGVDALNAILLAVSNDGGFTWLSREIPCSRNSRKLNHVFPSISIEPSGAVWVSWSDESRVFAARSQDQGVTWTCMGISLPRLTHAIYPWVVAGDRGVNLVYYGAEGPDDPSQRWFVYLAQIVPGIFPGQRFILTVRVDQVLQGVYCDSHSTRSCPADRTKVPLWDLPQADLDGAGRIHLVYTTAMRDGLPSTLPYTIYAVQTGGNTIGQKN